MGSRQEGICGAGYHSDGGRRIGGGNQVSHRHHRRTPWGDLAILPRTDVPGNMFRRKRDGLLRILGGSRSFACFMWSTWPVPQVTPRFSLPVTRISIHPVAPAVGQSATQDRSACLTRLEGAHWRDSVSSLRGTSAQVFHGLLLCSLYKWISFILCISTFSTPSGFSTCIKK